MNRIWAFNQISFIKYLFFCQEMAFFCQEMAIIIIIKRKTCNIFYKGIFNSLLCLLAEWFQQGYIPGFNKKHYKFYLFAALCLYVVLKSMIWIKLSIGRCFLFRCYFFWAKIALFFIVSLNIQDYNIYCIYFIMFWV